MMNDDLRAEFEAAYEQIKAGPFCGSRESHFKIWQAARAAQPAAVPVEITDTMAMAFHRAISDGDIGASEVEDIKAGLRAALCTAPQPAAPTCKCSMRTKLSGDGCEVCNPERAGDLNNG